MKFIKEAIKYYKELKLKEKSMEQLLSRNMDYNLMQELINHAANNPGLIIEINLRTGDKILLKTQEMKPTRPISAYIDGREITEYE